MSFKCFFNSHFVFVSQIHISFLQGNSFRFAVIKYYLFHNLLHFNNSTHPHPKLNLNHNYDFP